MKGVTIRQVMPMDRAAIRKVEELAFGRTDEAELVDALVAAGDDALELVAQRDSEVIGHILFSTLLVESGNRSFSGVALGPLAVLPEARRSGIGAALVDDAHRRLRLAGETLSVVLGDPDYYGRFGYSHERAEKFDSDYQSDALQALAWSGDAPSTGRLVYPAAFSAF